MWSSVAVLLSKGQNGSSVKYPLHLIAMVPLGNDDSANCVDRGEELIVAADIAIKRINEQELLPDFELRVIQAQTNNCTDNSATNALSLVSFANYSALARAGSSESISIIGVIGMVCSATMLTISPLASQPGINFAQITSGFTRPLEITRSRDRVNINNLFQTAPPSTIYNKALIALMRHQSWKRINVLRLSDSLIIDHDAIIGDLRERIADISDLSIQVSGEVQTAAILQEIKNMGIRIIYASVPDENARELLCEGLDKDLRLVWPQYAWILHDNPIEELMKPTSKCSREMMAEALKGVILLYYSVDGGRQSPILNTTQYSDYVQEYRDSLNQIVNRNKLCANENQIFYANAMHDSVLAFAKALNSSLVSGDITNSDLQNYRLGQQNVTERILEHLEAVSFDGAGGTIEFNTDHEVDFSSVSVNICQVDPDGTGGLIHSGIYNGTAIVEIKKINFIAGEFERIVKRIPLPLPIITFVLTAVFIVITTIVLALFIYYWDSHDIKATSPALSLVILAACYLLYVSVLLIAIRVRFTSGKAFAALCLAEHWFFIVGIQLLFSTLFWRLLRVYRIFFNYQKLGKLWSDYALLVYVLLVVSVSVYLLILWTAIDLPITNESATFIPDTNSPHYDVYLTCESERGQNFVILWLGLTLGYFALLLVFVVALAVMTRKVKIESFKDTKTVNAFIYTTAIVLGSFIPLSYILELGVSTTDTTTALSFSFTVFYTLVVAIACKAFLFAPKIYFARFPDEARHKTTSFATITNNQSHSQAKRNSAGLRSGSS